MVQAVLAAAPVAVSFPKLGILDLPVSRVAFQVYGIPVYWYGLLIASAIIIGLLLSMRQADHYGLKSDDVMDVFIFLIPMMIVFARAYYVIFEWDYYSQDLRRVFSTREGGLAFYGGLIGGILAVVLVTRFKKINLPDFLDFIVVYVPLGQAIGRWGNFFNQEAFGTNTDLPWGMISNQTSAYLLSVPGTDPFLPVHPTFLYEFLANGLIFFILLAVRRHRRFPLQVLLSYLMTYGFVRYFVEGIRTDALMFPGTVIRVSQILSAALVVVSIGLLILLGRRASHRRQLVDSSGSDFVELAQPDSSEVAQSAPVDTAQPTPVDVAQPDSEETDQSVPMDHNQHDG